MCNLAPSPEDVLRSGRVTPRILNLGTMWGYVLDAPGALSRRKESLVPTGWATAGLDTVMAKSKVSATVGNRTHARRSLLL
jgi:hypothetical protein